MVEITKFTSHISHMNLDLLCEKNHIFFNGSYYLRSGHSVQHNFQKKS
jgi:hypothetical protein